MAIGHPLGLNQLAFEQRYCQGHWRQIGERRQWQASGAERLEELQALTRPLLLHRRKQDCLELPPKRRRFQAVDLSTTEGRGFQHLLQAKVNDYRRRAARGEVRPGAESLAMLTALRQIGAQYKLPAARELVAELFAAPGGRGRVHGVRGRRRAVAAAFGRCLDYRPLEARRTPGRGESLSGRRNLTAGRHLRQRRHWFQPAPRSPRDPDRASPGPQATPSRPKTVAIASAWRAP